MQRMRLAGVSAALLVAICAGAAGAEDVSTKKLSVKNHKTDAAKNQIQVFSKDAGVLFSEADNPGTNGMSLHVYSATEDFCLQINAGAQWKEKAGKSWKYKNATTKNQAQIADGKLQVKVRSGANFDLTTTAQGTVNATVQFGITGVRYCMKCTTPSTDDALKYQGTDCAAAVCDAEPVGCDPVAVTTTTSLSTTTSTSLP